MITLITDNLPAFVTDSTVLSGRLKAWWNAYRSTPIAHFYRTEHDGAIAILDTTAIVQVPEIDRDEVFAFLALQSHIKAIYTNQPQIAVGKVKCFTPMRLCRQLPERPLNSTNLEALYAFLKPYFADLPPFESWYLDISYRTRHGQCRHTVIEEEGTIASSAMTIAEWDDGALLGAVATAPHHRRKGYAGQCVSALAGALQAQGKAVWICPYNEPARRLYLALGFVDEGQMALIERK